MDQKPTYKEEVLFSLRETLKNALSTLDRLMVEDNPVLERYSQQEVKDILGIPKVDSWCVRITKDNYNTVNNWFYGNQKNCYIDYWYGINHSGKKDWLPSETRPHTLFSRIISTENFLEKVGYEYGKQKEENILERGKEVLNSQNEENYIFKMGDYVSHKQDIVKGHTGVIISCDYKLNQYGIKFEDGYATYHAKFLKLEPKKEVLFTTEDGVDVYDGDGVLYVHKKILE